MKKRAITTPELMFIVTTRAVLAAGVALLFSPRLKETTRRTAGLALVGIGGVTTIPAAMMFMGRKLPFSKAGFTARWLE